MTHRLPAPCICGLIYLGECTAWYCGGNRARLERWKLTLGVRLRYLNAAPEVEGHSPPWLTTQLLCEGHRRGCYDRKLGWRVYQIDAGYCLDAPDIMPAGSCYGMEFPDEPELGVLPCQRTFDREPIE